MILDYPQGSDLTLMNTIYQHPKKQEDGKYTKPVMSLLYKDNITGQKHIKEIENPTYKFYVANEDVYLQTPEFFIENDKVHEVEVPYKDLEKEIAKITDRESFYYDNIKSGNRYANKELHSDPRIFRSDSDLQDHYRARFDKEYTNNIIPITKSYLDIEVDLCKVHYNKLTGEKELKRAIVGDFPEPGEVPINAVTYISDHTKEIYTFLLRNPDNPLIEQFEKNVGPDMFNRLRGLMQNTVGGYKKMRKLKLDQYEFKFIFYDADKEINLIADVFNVVRHYSPDFLLVWNAAFDIPYFIERIKMLGYDPKEIICDPDLKYKECEYFIDERNKNDFAERGDYGKITCKTVYIDQMIQFASRRKGQGVFSSYSLDSIAKALKVAKKLEYSHITDDIGEFPYLDYELFVFYNIIDTIAQKCVEEKTQDINYIFSKCILNDTRYQKGHRQTVYLTNRAGKFFEKEGYIIGNNQNGHNTPVSFGGGLVGDTTLINEYARILINDIPVNCYNNLDDFDFKSLYPSLGREFDLAPNTQIGKINIPEKIWELEDVHNDVCFDRAGLFMEHMQSHDYLLTCSRWFGLADFMTLVAIDLPTYFRTKAIPSPEVNDMLYFDHMHHPIIELEDGMMRHPIDDLNPMIINPIPDSSSYISDVMKSFNLEVRI